MKVGILLNGISHGTGRIFNDCYENILDTVINPFKIDNDVEVFLSTYTSEFIGEVIKTYSPKKHKAMPIAGSDPITTYIRGLRLLTKEDVDVIISSRFDIHFNMNVVDLDIDYDKINFLFKEKDWHKDPYYFVTDNLFVFPKKYLNDFIDGIIKLLTDPPRVGCRDMHGIYKNMMDLVGEDNLNIISDVEELSHDNTFYYLKRPRTHENEPEKY